jgi:hypothetical protein
MRRWYYPFPAFSFDFGDPLGSRRDSRYRSRMRRAGLLLVVVWSMAGCRKKEATHHAASPRDGGAVTTAPTRPAPLAIDHGWIDRCLGERRPVPWEPDAIIASLAAANAALDGATEVPRVDAKSHAPERAGEITWMVAFATLAAGRDASSLLDAAFAAATAVTDPAPRDRLLGWGAVELRRYDAARAATWAAAIKQPDYKPELAAYEVARLAASGDLEAARSALATLPPMWGLRTDVEYWNGYPRWLGSAAAAACVALAAPKAAASPAARALVEQADSLTANITEEWRQNREYRALALAWARIGDIDRAMLAASRMPGTERSGAIVDVLDGLSDAKTLDLAHVAALAKKAIAASRTAPLVLADPKTDRAELSDFIGQAVEGEVVAALARRYIARGNLTSAKAAVDAIPTNLSSHHEVALQLACARKKTGEVTLDAIVATLPGAYEANLAAAAAQVGCIDVLNEILRRAQYGERIAENVAWSTLAAGRLDDTLLLLRSVEQLAATRVAGLHADLAYALARAGRVTDAVAVLHAIPELPYKTFEQLVLAAGYRAVVTLVAAGDVTGAKAIQAELAPRLARVGTKPD